MISMFSGPVLPWLSMDENKLVLSVVPRALGSRESFFVMFTYMLWIPWGWRDIGEFIEFMLRLEDLCWLMFDWF